jgi:diaminopimelate decarboxylase
MSGPATADETLAIGGVRADVLARAYGTPLLAFDWTAIDAALSAFDAACAPFAMRYSYAAKAFLRAELVRRLDARGAGIDVCSLGELEAVEAADFPAARLTLHGAGKTDAELRAAIDGRVGRAIVDGLCDLRRLAELARGASPVRVVVRLNTGIDVDTHTHVRTVGEASKFGIVPEEEAAAIQVLRENPSLAFTGLHAHAGSQINDVATFAANFSALLEAADRFARAGFASRVLIAGGGFGVQYDPRRAEDAFDAGAAIAACGELARAAGSRASVEFEPGRSIVAQAGTTLYEVLAVKRRGDGLLVVVDGGMADNPRPALYDAYHHIIAVRRSSELTTAAVFGRACETDFIAEAPLPTDLARGDLLAVFTTGAYTYSMASNYNGFPKPALVAVRHGVHAPLV